jgi:hypothetical protein
LNKCTSTNDQCRTVLLADWGCRDVKRVDSRRDGSMGRAGLQVG